MNSIIYRDGKAVLSPASRADSVRLSKSSGPVLRPKASDAWSWMPPHRLRLLIEKVYARAVEDCTPPADEPLILDGRPFACKTDFATALADEFKDRIYEAVAGLDDGIGVSHSVPGGMGASPPCKRSEAEPDLAANARHVGVLDAAAAVRLLQRSTAP